MHAYLFWYRRDLETPTEYCYVIALSYKQARFFWFKYLKERIGYCEDYAVYYEDDILEADFVRPHQIGDILGQTAII